MTLNLKSLKQQIVIVGDVENVRNVLEKQRVSTFLSWKVFDLLSPYLLTVCVCVAGMKLFKLIRLFVLTHVLLGLS